MFGPALVGSVQRIAAEMAPAVTRAKARFMRRRLCSLVATGLQSNDAWVAKSPVDYPLSSHANAPAAHPVYGVTTE